MHLYATSVPILGRSTLLLTSPEERKVLALAPELEFWDSSREIDSKMGLVIKTTIEWVWGGEYTIVSVHSVRNEHVPSEKDMIRSLSMPLPDSSRNRSGRNCWGCCQSSGSMWTLCRFTITCSSNQDTSVDQPQTASWLLLRRFFCYSVYSFIGLDLVSVLTLHLSNSPIFMYLLNDIFYFLIVE